MAENADGSYEKPVSYEFIKTWYELRNRPCLSGSCSKCGKAPEELVWIKFQSSDRSFAHLAGRAGFRSFCINCNITVQEATTGMS